MQIQSLVDCLFPNDTRYKNWRQRNHTFQAFQLLLHSCCFESNCLGMEEVLHLLRCWVGQGANAQTRRIHRLDSSNNTNANGFTLVWLELEKMKQQTLLKVTVVDTI